VHQASTLNEQLLATMTVPAPPLLSLAPETPTEVANLVDRALRFDKAERFPNASAMQREVERVYEAVTGERIESSAPLRHPQKRSATPGEPTLSATQQPIPNEPPQATQRRWSPALVIAAGVAAAALFGLLGLLFRHRAPLETARTAAGASPALVPAMPPVATPATADLSPEAPAAGVRASASAAASPAPSAAPSAGEPRASARKPTPAKPAGVSSAELRKTRSPELGTDPFGRRK
jgi:serine/threonine-protein kinase